MKRASSGFLLLVAILAAIALIVRLGVFKRPDSTPPSPQFGPHRFGLHNPAALMAAPFSGVRHVPAPRSETTLPALSPAEAAQALNDWTYPGAVINSNPSEPPGSSQKGAQAHTRNLVAYAAEADVWRFYRAKAGVAQASQGPDLHTLGSPGGNPLSARPGIPNVAGISVARYGISEKNYSVIAVLVHLAGSDHTQISLQVIPRTSSPPPPAHNGNEPRSGQQPS